MIGPAAITLTLHNLAYHGWTPRGRVADLGLGANPPAGDAWGIDLLREGIVRAEMVNTVSPDVRPRGPRPGDGDGPRGQLRARGDRFTGILNGLDQGLWDPATDAAIAAPYDARRPAREGSLPGRPLRRASASTPPTRRRSWG